MTRQKMYKARLAEQSAVVSDIENKIEEEHMGSKLFFAYCEKNK